LVAGSAALTVYTLADLVLVVLALTSAAFAAVIALRATPARVVNAAREAVRRVDEIEDAFRSHRAATAADLEGAALRYDQAARARKSADKRARDAEAAGEGESTPTLTRAEIVTAARRNIRSL
jgi:hypothetical protein